MRRAKRRSSGGAQIHRGRSQDARGSLPVFGHRRRGSGGDDRRSNVGDGTPGPLTRRIRELYAAQSGIKTPEFRAIFPLSQLQHCARLDAKVPRDPHAAETMGEPMSDKQQNLQDTFLNAVRKSKAAVTIFLINGVKLQGNITWFDNFCVLLRRDGQSQLVYKHAISTVMPMGPIQLQDEPRRRPELRQQRFRHSCRAEEPQRAGKALRDAEARLEEAVGLTAAIHLDVVVAQIAPLARPTPATLLGTGKVEEIAALAQGRMSRTSSSSMPICRRCSSAIWRRPGTARCWTAPR